jgi:LAO/AO transport system kinase
VNELLARVQQGDQRAIARLISQVENDELAAQEAVAALYPATGQAHVVGITGPPGSGKSTLVSGLAQAFSDRGLRVGVIAVDPSSPFTGGALLGDRVRMADLAGNPAIFMRSMASRGTLGGLAQTTAVVIKILDAAGYEVILVETVGAGQAEVDIAAAAHTVLVVEAPGMGDEVQSIKAGILEIADVLVVNKADRPSARRTVSALEMMLHMGRPGPVRHHGRFAEPAASGPDSSSGWQVNVLQTVATEKQGIAQLVEQIEAHGRHLHDSGEWLGREKRRSRQEIERILQVRFAQLLATAVSAEEREALVTAVARRDLSPYGAAADLFQRVSVR